MNKNKTVISTYKHNTIYNGFKIVFMTHKQNLKYIYTLIKHKNEEEKIILVIVWMVGLTKHSNMDFSNYERRRIIDNGGEN